MNTAQFPLRALLLSLLSMPVLAETLTRTVAYEYDAVSGLVVREVVEPDSATLCVVKSYVYDAYGNRTSATTRNCNATSSGGLTEAAAPSGNAVFQSRTETSAFASGSVVIGGVTYNWTAGQFATTNANALSQSEAKEYDPRFGLPTKLTGPNGLITTWSYDSFGRKAAEARSDGTTTAWTYTLCGTCPAYGAYYVTETRTGAPTKTVYLDSLNREIRSEVQGFDGTLVRKDTQYDSQGRVAQVSKPYYAGQTVYWTTYQYDILGRVTQAEEPAVTAGTTRTATAFNGLTTTVTLSNAGGTTNMPATAAQTRATTRNSQGQVATVSDTQSNTITYTYDPFGNLKNTNAGGVITTMTYDLKGRKTQMVDADMGTWQYDYNALGELVWQKDAKLQVTTMSYDKLGRMTARTETDLVSSWYYDTYQGGGTCAKGIGKLCQVAADNGYGKTVSYDSQGRVASVVTTTDTSYTVSYTYDSSGRPDTVTYPTGFAVQNVYNSYGYQWKVQRVNDADTTVYWQANGRNAAGQVTSELLGNGLTTTRSYDALVRLTAIQSANTGGSVHQLAYSFDAIGNVSQRVDSVQSITENFVYDTLNRLTSSSGSGLTTRSFSYDAVGNVTAKSDVGTYTYPSTSSARPHAVSSVTNSGAANSLTASYGYDANGSLTSASGTIYPASGSVAFSRTLTYASFNMPATVSQTQGSSSYSYTYTYNPEHERVKLVTVRPDDTLTSVYLHPAGKGALLYEKEIRASDGRLEHKHYVNGGAGLVGVFVTKSAYSGGDGPQMRYYHRDHLGSVAVITNPSAAVLERLGYEAYGERRNSNGTPQDRSSPLIGVSTDRGFTAHEHLDELNLVHMNGRIYDPALARFMTSDPFVQEPNNLQSYNRLSYVNGGPLRYSDPSGYKKWRDFYQQLVEYPTKVALRTPVSTVTSTANYVRAQVAGWEMIWHGDFQDGGAVIIQSNNYLAMRSIQQGLVAGNPGFYLSAMQASGVGNLAYGSRATDSFGNTGRPGIYGILNRGSEAVLFDLNDVVLGYSGVPTASAMDYQRSHGREAPLGHSLGAMDAMNLVNYGYYSRADVYAPPGGMVAPYGVNVTVGRFDPVNAVPFGLYFLATGDGATLTLGLLVGGTLQQGINPTARVYNSGGHSRGCYDLSGESCQYF